MRISSSFMLEISAWCCFYFHRPRSIIEIIKMKFNSYSLVLLEDDSYQYTDHKHQKKHSAVIHSRIPMMILSMIQICSQQNRKFPNSKRLKKIHFPKNEYKFCKSKICSNNVEDRASHRAEQVVRRLPFRKGSSF